MASSSGSSTEWDLAAILAVIGIAMDTVIYTPSIVYWTYRLGQLKDSLIIRKRYWSVLLTICIVSCLYYVIQRNVGFLIYSGLLPSTYYQWLNYLNCFIFPMFTYGLYYLIVYRYVKTWSDIE